VTVEFDFENVFRAASVATVLAAYYDPDHLATQDRLAELGGRTVIDTRDDGATLARSWRVSALKPLPLFVRPFVSGGRLSFLESMTWRRADDEIDVTIQPEILGGRVQIAAIYQLRQVGEGQIHRRYKGTITVNIRLLSSRIERAIKAEFEKSMPMMAACTQGWLERARVPAEPE